MTDETPSAFQGVRVGERITGQVALSPEEIVTFARLCGDLNPLHHDETYARQTRFGGVIACGPHLTSLMMGLIATYFSRETAMLAGETITMQWEVTVVAPKASLDGEIVTLDGLATNQQGQVMLTGVGKVLVTAQL